MTKQHFKLFGTNHISQTLVNERKSLLHRSHVVLPVHMQYQKQVDLPHEHSTIGEGVINQQWVGGHQSTIGMRFISQLWVRLSVNYGYEGHQQTMGRGVISQLWV